LEKGRVAARSTEDPVATVQTSGTAAAAPELPHDRPVVIYDGECQLCIRSVALLRRLDVFGRLAYQNARETFQLPKTLPPIAADKLLEQMHVVTPGTDQRRAYGGFYAFRWLAWQLPVFWPLVPLLYLPGAAWVGERVYAWVARNRFRLVPCHGGSCSLRNSQREVAR
jgi:predicted DCC family thiol-disulfide oxidoreductase YuxK